MRTTGHVPISTRARRAPRRGPATSVSAHADDERRRQKFGRLAPVVGFLVGQKHSTEIWALGAEGEGSIGPLLSRTVGDKGVVLHDRRVPQSLSLTSITSLSVPSGVWVIDSKHYRGRLERRKVGGWFMSREAL